MLIVLTTTVFVQENKLYLFQIDPQERINTYLLSIKQWLENTKFNILVVDNSGYQFLEFLEFKENDRFQIISFKENEIPEAKYLLEDKNKGASELFAINYGVKKCKFFDFNFIIKVTGRYFIPDFEEYLKINLKNIDTVCQYGIGRCEMVGCKKKYFDKLFNISLQLENWQFCNHIEFLYTERINAFDKILICKPLQIQPTQQGGVNNICYYL